MQGERFIDVNGIRTRYFEKGTGEAVVFFHGSLQTAFFNNLLGARMARAPVS